MGSERRRRPNGSGRGRRSSGEGGSARWTAAQAAYRAVQLRDEVLERFLASPVATAIELGTKQDVISQWMRVYRQGGIAAADALAMCALRCGITAPLPAGATVETLARLANQQSMARDVDALKRGEVFVVSPAMHAVTVAAAQTLTEHDINGLREEDLHATAALVLLPAIQLLQQPGRPFPDEVLALSWGTRTVTAPDRRALRVVELVTWFDGNGPIQVPDFVQARRIARNSGQPLPRIMPLNHSRLALEHVDPLTEPGAVELMNRINAVQPTMGTELGEEIGDFHGGILEATADEWSRRYLFAFLRLCAQQVAVTTPYRELRGRDLPPRPTDPVRVTQLRSFSELAHIEQDHRREYQHRWVVRMHKVRQWYPSQGTHKVIWRGPYIKGPSHAPLLTGERVNALVR